MPRENLCQRITDSFKQVPNYFKYNVLGFLRNHKPWVAQAAVYVGAMGTAIGLVYPGIHEASEHFNKGAGWYRLARVSSFVLKWFLVPAAFLTASRVPSILLTDRNISKYLDLGRRMKSHHYVGGAIFFAMMGHVLGHAFSEPQLLVESTTAATGWVLMVLYMYPLFHIDVIQSFVRRCFPSYSAAIMRPHQIAGVGFMISYCFHRPLLWELGVVSSGLLLTDRLIEWAFFTHQSRTVSAEILPNTKYMQLRIEKKRIGKFFPGQYIGVKFSWDGLFGYSHKFGPLLETDTLIILLIKANGPATNKLYKLIQEGKFSSLSNTNPTNETKAIKKITISGPYGSPLSGLEERDELTVIGSGIGIISYLALLCYRTQQKMPTPLFNVHFSHRTLEEFIWCFEILSYVGKNNPGIIKNQTVNFYVTGEINPKMTEKQKEVQKESIKKRLKKLQKKYHFDYSIIEKKAEEKKPQPSLSSDLQSIVIEKPPLNITSSPSTQPLVARHSLFAQPRQIETISEEELENKYVDEQEMTELKLFNSSVPSKSPKINENKHEEMKILNIAEEDAEKDSLLPSITEMLPSIFREEKTRHVSFSLTETSLLEDKAGAAAEQHPPAAKTRQFAPIQVARFFARIHLHRMEPANIVANSQGDVTVCSNREIIDEVREEANRQGKRYFAESFYSR